MKILIDESLPRYLKRALAGYDVRTVQEMGWGGTKNGPLLTQAEGHFDVFLTGDKNLRYQQNLRERKLIIVAAKVIHTMTGKEASTEQCWLLF